MKIKLTPPDKQIIPDGLLDDARKYFKKGNFSYGLIPYRVYSDSVGKVYNNTEHRSCHGNITQVSFFPRTAIANPVPSDTPERKAFIEFIVSDYNPLAGAILNRETAVKDGGIVHSGYLPCIYFQWLNLLTRVLTENAACLKDFVKYREAGLHPMLAFVFAQTIQANYPKSPIGIKQYQAHGGIYAKPTETLLINLVSGNLFIPENLAVYETSLQEYATAITSSYYGVSSVGCRREDLVVFNQRLVESSEELREILGKNRGEEVNDSPITNPFLAKKSSTSKKKNPWDFTGDEWWNIVIPFIINKGLYLNGKTSRD